jgi:PAS domain S-box-containing protein
VSGKGQDFLMGREKLTRTMRRAAASGALWYCAPILAALAVLFLPNLGFAAEAPDRSEVIQTAEQVRMLPPREAQSRIPVRLKGVVTFFDETLYSRFIQDHTAGLYLRESTNTPGLKPGDLVEVEGVTSQGEYAPIVEPSRVVVVGHAPLPKAKPATFDQLASGREDSQFVQISGVVRSARFNEPSQHYVLELATGGGRLSVFVPQVPVPATELVDSIVTARGVCSTLFNRRRQLFAIRLMVPRAEDFLVVTPSSGEPFSIASRTIDSLLQFDPEGTYGHRVKVAGTVSLQSPGNFLFIQDGDFGLKVQTTQADLVSLGDVVEVVGFPGQGAYTPVLEDAVYRKVKSGAAPDPTLVTVDQALSGTYDSRLVRINAKVLDRSRQSSGGFLVLESSNFIFQAHLSQPSTGDAFRELRNNSQILVSGICLIDPGQWQAGEQWRARSFQLLLRSPGDVEVLKEPPWWTLRRLLWIVGALLVSILGALGWVAFLRRKVQQQTGIIRQQMISDAALKERYEDLFENANDMVFTHDLAGRITSINRAGEKLLQSPRAKILNTSLVSWVAEDERADAQDWLKHAARGGELQPVEWHFLIGSGQKIRLDISSRLIEQNGREPEIESIARDITERRRLERELLEISNREQRRIGHDLHDGVCQQLAGIAYRIDTLGFHLHEENRPEAGEADTIAGLIGEVTAQARSVARGLFPVRLEENGLIAALEELADGASARFPTECSFECQPPGPPALSNDKALHLYYIAQEALLNAVKHGKAKRVRISLNVAGERYSLAIRDDGAGFDPAQRGRSGMGTQIMHYRAKVIGAALEIVSVPGQGASVVCHFSAGPKT